MALTSAEVDLCNQSLDKIGASSFTFGDITSLQSTKCLLHFDQTRDSFLHSFEWQFSKTRLQLVADWATDTVYTTDQYVWEAGLLYKCAIAHTSDVFATDLDPGVDWVLISTVSAWVTATAYALGAFVVNDAVYYECILAHTSGDTDDEPGTGATWETYWKSTTTKPTNEFGYSYNLPAGNIRLVEFLGDTNVEWSLETNTILTSATTFWDSLFTELLITTLAKKLLSLAGFGPGTASLRADLNDELKNLNKRARIISRQESRGNVPHATWTQSKLTEANTVPNRRA